MNQLDDIIISSTDFVSTVEIDRPPHNFFDEILLEALADTFERLDADENCRCIVLASRGKSFCAGADLSQSVPKDGDSPTDAKQSKGARIYRQGARLYRVKKPIVAAVQGAAIGGGLGLALTADFRVTCDEGRFSANFTQLGFHPGFGISVVLPRLVGDSAAALMLYTSRRIKGADAVAMGLADMLVPQASVLSKAQELAGEIAACAPLAVMATRATLRNGLAEIVDAALDHELAQQTALKQTADFAEGVAATKERRKPIFTGK